MEFGLVEESSLPRGAVAGATVAALAAAVAGGVVWALIVRSTEYEIGLVAWAIGWLAGTAATVGGRGARGLPVQVVAVAASLLGILLGKYLSFAWALQELAREDGMTVGVFSSAMRSIFRDDLGTVFGWMDALFIGLAVVTAWRVPAKPAHLPARQPTGLVE
jgi:hypothetical protein